MINGKIFQENYTELFFFLVYKRIKLRGGSTLKGAALTLGICSSMSKPLFVGNSVVSIASIAHDRCSLHLLIMCSIGY